MDLKETEDRIQLEGRSLDLEKTEKELVKRLEEILTKEEFH